MSGSALRNYRGQAPISVAIFIEVDAHLNRDAPVRLVLILHVRSGSRLVELWKWFYGCCKAGEWKLSKLENELEFDMLLSVDWLYLWLLFVQ